MIHHQLLPDTILHVYCLQGVLPAHQAFPEGFLGNWEEEGYSYLFFAHEAGQYVTALARDHQLTLVDRHTIPYSQWQQSHHGSITVGSLVFSPGPTRSIAADNSAPIYLDSGIVFGDGLHPTTRECLTIMQRLFSEHRIASMLDLGTGSGVLALAGVNLGCSRVTAVDNIFLAAQTARRNVVLNGYEKKIMVVNGGAADCLMGSCDLLVANIQPEIIHNILESNVFRETNWFILSGMQDHAADRVMAHLKEKSVLVSGRAKTGAAWQTVWGRVIGEQ